ncbi:MAG: S1C family serine protease [Planctomyces sp.]
MKNSQKTRAFRFGIYLLGGISSLLLQAESLRADVEVYRKTLSSTAWVLAKSSGETSSGTGVLIDAEKKHLITNFHVVGEARTAVIFFADMKDEKPIVTRQHYLTEVKKLGVRGKVIGIDRKRDLALIELDRIPEGATAVKLAEKSIGPGEDVQSIGNPGTTDALWVYTSGTVRAVYPKTLTTDSSEYSFEVVETQSPINAGDSGGPVVNNNGELVAVSQAFSPRGRLVSYNIDISEVREFLSRPFRPAPLPIADVLKMAELEFRKHESGHLEVEFEQKDKVKQTVFIAKDVEYYERADLRKVWSLAAVTKEAPTIETTMRLLEQSSVTKLGAWNIERNSDGEYLYIYSVKLDASAAPDAVKSTMEYVGKLTNAAKKDFVTKSTSENAAETLDSWLKE